MTGMSTRTRWYLTVAMSAVVLAAGCSSDDTDTSSTDTSSTETASADTTSETVEVASTVGDSTVAASTAVDVAAALQVALDDLAESGYHFVTRVTAGGSLALHAEGDHVGEGSRFEVVREDLSVEYVVTPEGTWARPDGGEWVATEAPTATIDPVSALAEATSVTLESSDGEASNLVATVPDTAFGYDYDREIDVTVTLVDGAVSEIRYETTVQGLSASVLTTFGPVTDDAPIVAPV